MKDNQINKKWNQIAIIYAITLFIIIILDFSVIFSKITQLHFNYYTHIKIWSFIIIVSIIISLYCKSEINRRKQNQKTSELNYERYLNVFNNTYDAILILENDKIIECNNSACTLFKRNKYEIINKNFTNISTPSQENKIETNIKFNELKNSATNNQVSSPWQFIIDDNTIINSNINITKLDFISNNTYQIIAKDVSNRIEDQLLIKQSEKNYQEIVDTANSAIVKIDLSGKLTFINEYTEKLYGYTLDEVKDHYIFEVFKPLNRIRKAKIEESEAKKYMQRILREIITQPTQQNWNYTKSGKKIFMNWTSKPIYNTDNSLIGILSIGNDQTEQKIMYDRLKRSENNFKTVFNEVTEGITIISFDGDIIEQNKEALEFLGFKRSDIGKDMPTKEIVKQFLPNLETIIEQIKLNGEIVFEADMVSADGEEITAEIGAKIIEYGGEKVIIAVSRDIIERKINQQKIFNAALIAEEKERSRVAKELHDSVSPILSTAKLYAQTLVESENKEMQNEIISKVESAINDSIRSIYEISNKLSPHILENFGVVEAINSFIEKIPNEQPNFEVKSNLKERLNKDTEVTLYRVAIELINNTLKHANASKVFISLNIKNNIQLDYTDNGIGFDLNDYQENSRGMGLFNITNRVKSLNGKIEIISKINEGFKVKVTLPKKINNE